MRSNSIGFLLGIGVVVVSGACALACDGNGGTGDEGGSAGSAGNAGSSGNAGSAGNAGSSGNAGSAGNAGSSGNAGSGGSAPACGPGTELCGDACTVTDLDPMNCGTCGNACAELEVCSQGTCASACLGGTTQCGQLCVDMDLDPENCGTCGNACDAAQEMCAKGQCVPACGSGGLSKCDDACVDMKSDEENCGQCGDACGATELCIDSQCVAQVAPKAVYTMTNDAAGNKILAFNRAADGSLAPAGTFTATGGLGSGNGLGNQHGLIFDQAQNLFFAVNAGDNTISMLALNLDGALKLMSVVNSGGVRPISVTASGSVVYVVNAGTANTAPNISGFKIMGKDLMPIAGSTQPLSAATANPAQIQFTPDGKTLVVTEKGTSAISTYAVNNDVAGPPVVSPSAGQTPFGFDFTANQHLIVSEAQGGMANMSTTSSYSIGANGMLMPVSAAVPTTRSAACWLVVAGDYAYVANAGTNDITGFKIAANGALSLLNADGITGQTTMGATDEDVTDDNDFLYVVNNGAHVFSVFQINADGSLSKKPDFMGLPTAVSGIVAR